MRCMLHRRNNTKVSACWRLVFAFRPIHWSLLADSHSTDLLLDLKNTILRCLTQHSNLRHIVLPVSQKLL
jgi:hypothetical protein